ncbi:hypothetical protein TL16_g11904 [Triparma laevis f. inornata]|uniref:Uncharacterized protein n=1 Tax=Triparma laevis f. inornata TaxID=1714386 RepID=A0A9W7BNL6_9STRA|nr:hypothetical protein TL16_g11904 [Triparma laevis f. inornata]
MSLKRIATRSSSRLKAQELGEEKGGEDGESQNQGQGQGPVVAPATPTTKDDFMATDDFVRLLRVYGDVADLFHAFRLVSKSWQRIAEEEIDWGFESGVFVFHDGKDVSHVVAWARKEKRKLVKRVVFLLNITKVGVRAYIYAVNLVVVEIPDGVESIGVGAFTSCHSLTTVSFPTTLNSVGASAFRDCPGLDNVNLLHTNLQELGYRAFYGCSELGSMTIPDSLQTFGGWEFTECLKLVPSHIDVSDWDGSELNTTPDVIAYLRTKQRIAALEKKLAERDAENAALNATIAERDAEVATLATENAALTTEVAALKIANAPPAHTNDFMSTIDFKRHFVGFVHIEMLLVLREVCKEWNEVVKEVIDESVESGVIMVHDGKDIDEDDAFARKDRRELVTQVIFLLNITKVGDYACEWATNLVVVDVPGGVLSIGEGAFASCWSLTTVSFPTTLISIGAFAFINCTGLEIVDLFHTNLQELGEGVFSYCSELTSMTIPDSLQTLGSFVFDGCSKLVPSSIDVSGWNGDATSKVIARLRSKQPN